MPTRVGTDTNWIAVASSPEANVAFKDDGTIWRWGRVYSWSENGAVRSETVEQPQQWLAFPGRQRPVSLSFDGYGVAAVCNDGSLWALTRAASGWPGEGAAETTKPQWVRQGDATDWKQVVVEGLAPGVAIKRDGSMWRWKTIWHSRMRYRSLEQLSDYNVWASVCSYAGAYLSLGRDGSLCLWGQPEERAYFEPTSGGDRWLLAPTRLNAVEIADLARR